MRNDVRPMVETVPLEQAADAYARMLSGAARFRMVITNNYGRIMSQLLTRTICPGHRSGSDRGCGPGAVQAVIVIEAITSPWTSKVKWEGPL